MESNQLTAPEVRQWFLDHGISVTDWARERGFRREVVYAALAGRTRGYRGQAHQVAVALGLKKQPADVGGLATPTIQISRSCADKEIA